MAMSRLAPALTGLLLLYSLTVATGFVQPFTPRASLVCRHETVSPDHDNTASSSSSTDLSYYYHPSEFVDLEPLPPPSERRQARLQQELEATAQFVPFGDDLWTLRSTVDQLSKQLVQTLRASLQQAKQGQNTESIQRELHDIRQQLRLAEAQDPELVYKLALADAKEATTRADQEQHDAKAKAARSCQPQFQLEGLWVGKYGEHGYELVNVSTAVEYH